MTPYNMQVDYVGNGVIYIHRTDELTIQKIVDDEITVIDASVSAQGIADTINTYTVEEIDINIVDQDPRFTPYRFAYVNNWGGTDYINFDKADREKLGIKKSTFDNDNKEILYNVDVTQKFSVYSQPMTELESKNLRYFWISPLVELIKNGVHYPVSIVSTSESILRKKEQDLITYKVTFTYQSNFNIQK